MSKSNGANATGAGTGRWVLAIVALMCAAAYGGVAWQKGTLDPMVLLLGPTHSDPEMKRSTKEVAKKVEPELSEELAALQYEPDDESDEIAPTTDSDLEMSISDDEEAGDAGIRPAGYEIDADAEQTEAAIEEETPPARTAARVRDTDAARDSGVAKKKSPHRASPRQAVIEQEEPAANR